MRYNTLNLWHQKARSGGDYKQRKPRADRLPASTIRAVHAFYEANTQALPGPENLVSRAGSNGTEVHARHARRATFKSLHTEFRRCHPDVKVSLDKFRLLLPWYATDVINVDAAASVRRPAPRATAAAATAATATSATSAPQHAAAPAVAAMVGSGTATSAAAAASGATLGVPEYATAISSTPAPQLAPVPVPVPVPVRAIAGGPALVTPGVVAPPSASGAMRHVAAVRGAAVSAGPSGVRTVSAASGPGVAHVGPHEAHAVTVHSLQLPHSVAVSSRAGSPFGTGDARHASDQQQYVLASHGQDASFSAQHGSTVAGQRPGHYGNGYHDFSHPRQQGDGWHVNGSGHQAHGSGTYSAHDTTVPTTHSIVTSNGVAGQAVVQLEHAAAHSGATAGSMTHQPATVHVPLIHPHHRAGNDAVTHAGDGATAGPGLVHDHRMRRRFSDSASTHV